MYSLYECIGCNPDIFPFVLNPYFVNTNFDNNFAWPTMDTQYGKRFASLNTAFTSSNDLDASLMVPHKQLYAHKLTTGEIEHIVLFIFVFV